MESNSQRHAIMSRCLNLGYGSFSDASLDFIMDAVIKNGGNDSISDDQLTVILDKVAKYVVMLEDISRGKEPVKISVVDETGGEAKFEDLEKFTYLPKNIVMKNTDIRFTLDEIGSNCCEDCGDECIQTHCKCLNMIGHTSTYTHHGVLTAEFLEKYIQSTIELHPCPGESCLLSRKRICNGHINRLFIKECCIACKCSMICANRVVQKGIKRNLQVFFANGEWGIRTLDKLLAGSFVFEYTGEIATNTEMHEKYENEDENVYSVSLDADLQSEINGDDNTLFCLDANKYGNISRFLKGRSSVDASNLIHIPVWIENNNRRYYHVAFFTRVDVDPLEELIWEIHVAAALKRTYELTGKENKRDKRSPPTRQSRKQRMKRIGELFIDDMAKVNTQLA